MKILLDTHIVLWALDDNSKLSEKARKLILDESNILYYSTASVWEIAIKHMAKPEKIIITGKQFSEYCQRMGYQTLAIEDRHVRALESLVYYGENQEHKDPFDRIMIAQAKAENFYFMTHDTKIPFYNEKFIISV